MAMKYIKAYYDWLDIMDALSDGERGRLITAVLKYARSGIEPDLHGSERFVFPSIRAQIDRDAQSYSNLSEKRREFGSRGGVAKASKSYQDKEEEKEKDKDKEKENKEKDITSVISKKKYGEFENVLLSDTEREKLDDQLGDICAEDYIEKMSAYIAQSGTKYKSHYAAILTWWRKDGKPVERHARIGILPHKEKSLETIDDVFGPGEPVKLEDIKWKPYSRKEQ